MTTAVKKHYDEKGKWLRYANPILTLLDKRNLRTIYFYLELTDDGRTRFEAVSRPIRGRIRTTQGIDLLLKGWVIKNYSGPQKVFF